MAKSWSGQLAEQFSLTLPADVEAWLDSENWKEESPTSFGEGNSPPRNPGDVWGGQMLPDTLPILGNWGGDYLCLRFRPDGSVSEVVRWLHEGSLWVPYGNSLTEALLFDACLSLAKRTRSVAAQDPAELPVFALWALNSINIDAPKRAALQQDLSLEALLQAGIAETAVRLELCKKCCMSGLMRHCQKVGGSSLAKQLGVDWLTFSKWLWDTKFVPKGSEKKLANATGMGLEELLIQDWAGAKRHAQEVIKLRTDLAWPFAVTGWSSEREGHFQEAIAEYYVGLRALATTADFTEAWGITDSGRQKFVLNRLRSVPEIVDARIVQDEYVRAALNAESSAHEGGAIRTYWLHQGEKAEREGFYNQAYQYYYSAGWDRYCFDDMGIVLDALVRSATAAGWAALAKIAQLHLQSLSRK